ncbi:MAG: hypothetical protein U9R74_12450 [Pseudomonadota bacterium]|nr:hypothetical protein [Pseudomonadota bacterium]
MSDPVLKLQILARAEMALAQIRARRAASRSALFSVALLFGLLGLGMLNLAGFHALTPEHGPAMSAFLVSLANLALAIILILVAKGAGPSENEEKMAREMRDLAWNELSNDINQVKAGLTDVTSEVRRIRSGFTSFSGSAINSLGPVLGLLIKAVKRDKTSG